MRVPLNGYICISLERSNKIMYGSYVKYLKIKAVTESRLFVHEAE
jgi:hypothetical protein